jgi:hypothetical protein
LSFIVAASMAACHSKGEVDSHDGSGFAGAGGANGATGGWTTGGGGTATGGADCRDAGRPTGVPPQSYAPLLPDGGALTSSKGGCPEVVCTNFVSKDVSSDDRSVGFSATELFAGMSMSADLAWWDGTFTTLRFQVSVGQGPVTVALPRDGADGGAQAPDASVPGCRSLFVEAAVVELSTDDGRLQGERILMDFGAASDDGGPPQTTISAATYPLRNLQGSLRVPADWSPGDDSRFAQSINVYFNPSSNTCNPFCKHGPDQPITWSWVDPCGYDGTIEWFTNFACGAGDVTIAAWKWR